MAGMYGTTQSYQGMADTFMGLAPSCGDKLFGSGIDYCDLVQWGIYDGQENDPRVLQKYWQQRQQHQKSLALELGSVQPQEAQRQASTEKVTVASALSQLPHLSQFREVCERSGWMPYLDGSRSEKKITLFAPTNEAWQSKGWDLQRNVNVLGVQNAFNNELRLIAQAHTLPFGVEQTELVKRKVRLYTSLEGFTIYVDGTGEVRPTLNVYQPSPEDEWLNFQYPVPRPRMDIVETYYTNNGALYVINGVFRPTVIVT